MLTNTDKTSQHYIKLLTEKSIDQFNQLNGRTSVSTSTSILSETLKRRSFCSRRTKTLEIFLVKQLLVIEANHFECVYVKFLFKHYSGAISCKFVKIIN